MMSKNLVFLSYGSESEYYRAIFCVFSFLSWVESYADQVRIVIYTDQPEFFKKYLVELNIEYFLLTPEILEDMLDHKGFIHRRKVAVIDQTFKDFPGEYVLFIDSDTFFISPSRTLLEGPATGESFMHKREYTIEKGLAFFTSFNQGRYPAAFIEYISGRDFIINGKSESFNQQDYSWNSGVLGLNKDFAIYMAGVYQLTDDFYANSKWFISEQMAFSLILQRTTSIKPADDFLLHYWGKRQKVLMDKLIAELLNTYSVAELKNSNFIKPLTRKWKKRIESDLIMEQVSIALSSRSWLYGAKKCLQVAIRQLQA